MMEGIANGVLLFSFTKKLFFYIKFNNIIKINGHRSMNTHHARLMQIAFLDPLCYAEMY